MKTMNKNNYEKNKMRTGKAGKIIRCFVGLFFVSIVLMHCSKEELQEDAEAIANAGNAANAGASVEITQNGPGTIVTEGEPTGDTYSIRLTSKPETTVSIRLNNNDSEVTIAPTILNFTPTNYNQAQNVTIVAVDDNEVEGDHSTTIEHRVISGDASYLALAIPPVIVIVLDNDVAGLMINKMGSGLSLGEWGAGDSYTLRLTKKPMANVIVSLDLPVGLASNITSAITFTPNDWANPRTILVTPENMNNELPLGFYENGDLKALVLNINHTVSSIDANYDQLINPALQANIHDDDTVIYVDANIAVNNGDGRTWQTAFNNLPDAVAALKDRQQIWLKEGTYFASKNLNKTDFLTISNKPIGVKIIGGFSGIETNQYTADLQANPTRITGDLWGNDDYENNWPNNSTQDDNSHRLFTIFDSRVTFETLEVWAGNAAHASDVGADAGFTQVHDLSHLTLKNVDVRYHRANDCGGAVDVRDQSGLTIINSLFSNNQAAVTGDSGAGGGVLFTDTTGKIEIVSSQFTENASLSTGTNYEGGALFIYEATELTVANSIFTRNSSASNGGAIYISDQATDPAVNIFNTEFSENHAATDGSAIYSDVAINIAKSRFYQNTHQGGAIALQEPENGPSIISESEFLENSSTSFGGAILFTQKQDASPLQIRQSLFKKNIAEDRGGAIASRSLTSDGAANNTISDSRFIENEALNESGGAIYTYDINYTIDRTHFEGNRTSGSSGVVAPEGSNGGGIALFDATVVIRESILVRNHGAKGAGGIFMYQESGAPGSERTIVTIESSILMDNTLGDSGSYRSLIAWDPANGNNNDGVEIEIKNSILLNAPIYFDLNSNCNSNCISSATIRNSFRNAADSPITHPTGSGHEGTPGQITSTGTIGSANGQIFLDDTSEYRLCQGKIGDCVASNLLGAGDISLVSTPFDIFGNDRLGNGGTQVDLGPHQSQPVYARIGKDRLEFTEGVHSGYQNLSTDATDLVSHVPDAFEVLSFSGIDYRLQSRDNCDFEPAKTVLLEFRNTNGSLRVPLDIIDNDEPTAICLVKNLADGLLVNGSTSDSYSIALTKAPTSEVTVNLNQSNGLSLPTSTLTFTGANWMTAQTVTISKGSASAGVHGITYTITSSDTDYNGLQTSATMVEVED